MRKVTLIYGSPRKNGNSATLGKQLCSGLAETDAIVEEFYLHGMHIKPCSACDSCQRSDEYTCIIDDDMSGVLRSASECDVLVLAGPIYNFNVSAQMKIFLDRSYCLWKERGSVLKGTNVVFILTYADDKPENSGVYNAIKAMTDGYDFVEASVVKILHYTAGDAGAIAGNQLAMAEAKETGIDLGNGTF